MLAQSSRSGRGGTKLLAIRPPDQIGGPVGILHIGLAPRPVAHVPGIADDQLETPLEDGVDRAPGDARALHPNVRRSRFPQPVPQRFEVPRHGRETSAPPCSVAPGRAALKARHDRLLMHVPNDRRDLWLPFTPNRALKKRPRLISRVKDMHYFLRDARSSARAFTSISLKSLKPLSRLQAAMDSTAT